MNQFYSMGSINTPKRSTIAYSFVSNKNKDFINMILPATVFWKMTNQTNKIFNNIVYMEDTDTRHKILESFYCLDLFKS